MSLTISQQERLDELRRKKAAFEGMRTEPTMSHGPGDGVNSYKDMNALQRAAAQFKDEWSQPDAGKKFAKEATNAAGPAAGAVLGAEIGAFPALSVPTAGLSIPIGGALGAGAGYIASRLATRTPMTKGDAAEEIAMGAIPPAKLAGKTAKQIIPEAIKQGIANLGAKAVGTLTDRGELPNAPEAIGSTVGGMAGTYLAKPFAKGATAEKAALEQSRYQTRDDTLRFANSLGFVLDPAQSNPDVVANRAVITMAGGQSAFNSEARRVNQSLTNDIVRQEIGLARDAELNNAVISVRKLQVSQPYGELAAISPAASTAIEELKQARADARDYWQSYARNADPSHKKAAEKAMADAAKYEATLEGIAKSSGKAGLVDRLREARQQLAKIHVVESALNGSAQDVDANIIGKIHDKNPNLLTGGLKVVGELANIQPQVMGEALAPKFNAGNQVTRGTVSAALSAFGYSRFGFTGAAGGVAAGLAVPPAMLKLAKSKPYQAWFAIPRYNTNAQDSVSNFILKSTESASR